MGVNSKSVEGWQLLPALSSSLAELPEWGQTSGGVHVMPLVWTLNAGKVACSPGLPWTFFLLKPSSRLGRWLSW